MDQNYGQAHLAVHDFFRKLYSDEKEKQDAGTCFQTWEPFRGNNKCKSAPILAYSKDIDDILKDAPNVDFDMVKRSVVTAENIENAFSKNAKQILYARRRRKNDGIKKYHIFVPSTLKLFEQALLQFSTVVYPEATPVQTVEQTIRKDVGREDAGATGQITTELQATVGLESPTTLPGEANAIGADVIETGQTMKLENQELRKEIVAVKKERDLLKTQLTTLELEYQELKKERHQLKQLSITDTVTIVENLKKENNKLKQMLKTQENNVDVESLEQNKRRREPEHFFHKDDIAQVNTWVKEKMILKHDMFLNELFEFMQMHIDEKVARVALEYEWTKKGWL